MKNIILKYAIIPLQQTATLSQHKLINISTKKKLLTSNRESFVTLVWLLKVSSRPSISFLVLSYICSSVNNPTISSDMISCLSSWPLVTPI